MQTHTTYDDMSRACSTWWLRGVMPHISVRGVFTPERTATTALVPVSYLILYYTACAEHCLPAYQLRMVKNGDRRDVSEESGYIWHGSSRLLDVSRRKRLAAGMKAKAFNKRSNMARH